MAMINDLTVLHLERALEIKKRIEQLERELQQLLDTPARSRSRGNSTLRKHYISAAGRSRIAEAQRARWARVAASQRQGTVAKHKNRTTASGRARIAAAQRRRWEAGSVMPYIPSV